MSLLILLMSFVLLIKGPSSFLLLIKAPNLLAPILSHYPVHIDSQAADSCFETEFGDDDIHKDMINDKYGTYMVYEASNGIDNLQEVSKRI